MINRQSLRPFKQIGKNLAEMRRNKDKAAKEVAEATGISKEHLSRIERGRVNMTMETLRKLAIYYECELKDIFKGT